MQYIKIISLEKTLNINQKHLSLILHYYHCDVGVDNKIITLTFDSIIFVKIYLILHIFSPH